MTSAPEHPARRRPSSEPAAGGPGGERRGRGRLSAEDARELDAQLLAAALEAFATQGYGATSMAALARAAGVSKTTLYAKHPTKAALFRAVTERQSADAYALARDTAGERGRTLSGSLTHLAEQTVLTASSPQTIALNRLLEWEAARFPELAEILQARSRAANDFVAGLIRRFAELDAQPCRDPAAAAAVFTFAVRGLYHDISTGVRSPRPVEVRHWVGEIVANYMASRRRW